VPITRVSNYALFASRPPGGPWSATESIRDSRTGTAWAPSLATDSAGNLHAVWSDERNGNDDIYAAYRPAGGPWSADVRVNDDATGKAQYMPGLAVDGAGNVTALWTDDRGADSALYAATRSRGHGWGSNESLITWPGAASRGQPAEALAPDGPATMDTFMFAVQYVNDVLAVLAALPVPGMESIYNVVVEQFDALAGSGDGPYQDGNAAGAPALNSDQGAYPPNAALGWPVDLSGEPLGWPVDLSGSVPADYYNAVVTEATGEDWWKYVDDATYQQHMQQAKDLAGRIDAVGLGYVPEYILQDMTPAELAWMEEIVASIEYQQLEEQIEAAEAAKWAQQEAKLQAQLDEEADYLAWLAHDQAQAAQQMTPLNAAAIGAQAVQTSAAQPTQQQQTQPTQQQKQTQAQSPSTAASGSLKKLQEAMKGNVANLGKKPPTRATDPVLPHSGEFVYSQTPLSIPGRGLDYLFTLSYHSQLVYDGPAGWGCGTARGWPASSASTARPSRLRPAASPRWSARRPASP